MTASDEQASTKKLIQDVALARQRLLASSCEIKTATTTLEAEIRRIAVCGSTIAIALLSGALLERAVCRDRSPTGSLANVVVILKGIVTVLLTGLSSSRPSNDTRDTTHPSSGG